MKRNATLAVYLLLVFASGVLVGSLGQRFFSTRTVSAQDPRRGRAEEFRRRLMAEMRRRLNLRADQEQQVNAAFDATRDRMTELQRRNEPEIQAIRHEQHDRIRAILDPAQRTEYDKMLEERAKHKRPGEK